MTQFECLALKIMQFNFSTKLFSLRIESNPARVESLRNLNSLLIKTLINNLQVASFPNQYLYKETGIWSRSYGIKIQFLQFKNLHLSCESQPWHLETKVLSCANTK